jgi:hypothetical protein
MRVMKCFGCDLPLLHSFQRRRGDVFRRCGLLAWALALLMSTGLVRAAPFLHAQVLVFVPAYEASQLLDPDLDKRQNDPACVWGSMAVLLSSKLYFGLRMPNPLLAKPMLAVGPIDIYRKFIDTMTEVHADAPRFSPYSQGSDFFLFAYDWRQEIASVSAPLLGEALENYARIHERKTGIPAGQTKFTIVTHSMGGLLVRTLLSEKPEWASRISRLYLGWFSQQGLCESDQYRCGGSRQSEGICQRISRCVSESAANKRGSKRH